MPWTWPVEGSTTIVLAIPRRSVDRQWWPMAASFDTDRFRPGFTLEQEHVGKPLVMGSRSVHGRGGVQSELETAENDPELVFGNSPAAR